MNSVQILTWVALAINLMFLASSVREYFRARTYTRKAKELVDEIEREFYPKKIKLQIVKGGANDSSNNVVS
jgi:ABC-type uncharacterized transport system involved in gliding motility auxiliary subunit